MKETEKPILTEGEEKPKLMVEPPQLPCDQCIENEGKILNDELVIVYCKHNCSGAVYSIRSKTWQISHRVTLEEFRASLFRSAVNAKLLKTIQVKAFDEFPTNGTVH